MKILPLVVAALVSAAACESADARSKAVRERFQHEHPCPSTGKPRGACPGWVIDHVVPLCAGGADNPSNMQWQTVDDAKAKDKLERKQCRATLEALAEIKNPRPVAFVKQANITNGAQGRRGARGREPRAFKNELLRASHGIELDTRAQSKAGGADPHMATVGAIDRPAHSPGQGPDGAQR